MSIINTYGMPFTDTAGDRKYGSGDWKTYFGNLCNSGIVIGVRNELVVTEAGTPAKTVEIDTGAILIEGVMIDSDQVKTLNFTDNTSGNPRIDRVVARLDNTNRLIEFDVLVGTPAASPTAPSLTRTTTTYELSLAQVYLANGYSTITDSVITDERDDSTVCGYASSNTSLKITTNRFDRTSDLTLTGGATTEIPWQTQTDSSNPIIYLSSNKIYISSRVQMFWITGLYYIGYGRLNLFFTYPTSPETGYFFLNAYAAGEVNSVPFSACIPGSGSTDYLKCTIFTADTENLEYDPTWISVSALYV